MPLGKWQFCLPANAEWLVWPEHLSLCLGPMCVSCSSPSPTHSRQSALKDVTEAAALLWGVKHFAMSESL